MNAAYILDERRLERNLRLLQSVRERTGIKLLLALKAYALWKTFPLFADTIDGMAASGLWEARLASTGAPMRPRPNEEEFIVSTFSPAFEDATFDEVCRYSSHIVFNSLGQYERFHKHAGRQSIGLRINPHYSEIDCALYDPVAPGTRLGVSETQLPEVLPHDVEGLHFHCLCENGAETLVKVLESVEQCYSQWLDQVAWLNMGGGHLMTREGYDIELLVGMLAEFRMRHPHLQLLMEPGAAFVWDTGTLRAEVEDIVEDSGVKTAVLNVSIACHMPDCLEMPYLPRVAGAETVDGKAAGEPCVYRLGGNSCLSGDFMGMWRFERPLKVGDSVEFADMIHYTTVKTTMFNGMQHPDILLRHKDGRLEVLRSFGFDDYRGRMD